MKNIFNKIKKNPLKAIGFLIIVLMFILISCRNKNRANTIQPIHKNIIDAVFASGYTINSDEYIVATKTEGFILKSYVTEGDSVKVGDLLFQLSGDVQSSQLENALAQYNDALYKASPESPQIISQEKQIEQLKSQLELDRKNYERYKELIKTNAVSKVDFEKAKLQYEASVSELEVLENSLKDLMSTLQLNLDNAESQLKIQKDYFNDYFIKSTKKGRVLNVFKEQGELAKRGESLAKIGSGKTIARLFIAEEDIKHIKIGQKTKIALNTNKDNPVNAFVSKIYPSFDFSEQSFVLEAEFLEEDNRIFPNTQLQANIIIAEKKNALVIPAQYLNERNQVTLSDNFLVTVKVGIRANNWVEIISGLNETSSIKKVE
jgi:multidrug efflux pump subunit AcrA (membrane-fusion protein)